MSKWRCNSCEGEYSDTTPQGAPYFHACSPEVIEPAAFGAQGELVTPEKRTQRQNARDENTRTDIVERDGKWGTVTGSTAVEGGEQFTPLDSLIVSEGLGRTLLE